MRTRSLVAIAIVLGAAGLAGALVIGAALWRQPAQAVPAQATLGKARLQVPPAYLRFPGDLASGALERLDLAAFFPDFAPAASLAGLKPGAGLQERSDRTIFLTLKPEETTLPPADRPARLYARFLSEVAWAHPGGLQMRRFQQGSPYESEELYIAPPEGRVFFARCARPLEKPDGLPDSCLTEFRQNGLDVQMRFSPTLLPDWEKLIDGAKGLVQGFAR